MILDFKDFSEMNFIARIYGDSEAFNSHERAMRSVAIREMDFIKIFSVQASCPMWFDSPVFGLFDPGCNLIKPLTIDRELKRLHFSPIFPVPKQRRLGWTLFFPRSGGCGVFSTILAVIGSLDVSCFSPVFEN